MAGVAGDAHVQPEPVELRPPLWSGLLVEGIFRRSPSAIVLQQTKNKLHRGTGAPARRREPRVRSNQPKCWMASSDLGAGEPVDLAALDIHVTAVLLKMYLRELPTPLFPDAVTSLFDAVRGASGCSSVWPGERLGLMTADPMVRARAQQKAPRTSSAWRLCRPLCRRCQRRTRSCWPTWRTCSTRCASERRNAAATGLEAY